MSNVVSMGAHDNMTPEQALTLSAREDWEKVIIVGFHKADNELIVRSSAMSRESASWILDHAKLHALNISCEQSK